MKWRLPIILGLLGCQPTFGQDNLGAPFVVKLSLDQRAETKLAESGEGVVVQAYYYWRPNSDEPARETKEFDVALGGYPIGEESHELKGKGTSNFLGRTASSSRIVADQGDARVLINVFSARQSYPDNILNCGIFDDTLDVARVRGIEIGCSLLR